jgi:hypothetical protein
MSGCLRKDHPSAYIGLGPRSDGELADLGAGKLFASGMRGFVTVYWNGTRCSRRDRGRA